MRRATRTVPTARPHHPISIHALHEESDKNLLRLIQQTAFQSTLSMRRATRQECLRDFQSVVISIHALHEESDMSKTMICRCIAIFQSTLSMRRATHTNVPMLHHTTFQSTLSMRRATKFAAMLVTTLIFQSTLSMRRATQTPGCGRLTGPHFNPRSP